MTQSYYCYSGLSGACGFAHKTRAAAEKCIRDHAREFGSNFARTPRFNNLSIAVKKRVMDASSGRTKDEFRDWLRDAGNPITTSVHRMYVHDVQLQRRADLRKKRADQVRQARRRRDGGDGALSVMLNLPEKEKKNVEISIDDTLAAKAIAKLIAPHVTQAQSDSIRELVAKEVAALAPRRHIVKVGDNPERDAGTHLHPAFKETVELLAAGKNVIFVGPAGSGKTHLARQAATFVSLPYRGIVSFTAGLTEAAITGRCLPSGEGGRFEHHTTPLLKAYEEGGVVVLDEIFKGDANTLSCLAPFLAARKDGDEAFVPQRFNSPSAYKHRDFRAIATSNKFGKPDRMYISEGEQSEDSLDRWRMGVVFVDYDEKLEAALLGVEHKELHGRWLELRKAARKHQLRHEVSTRVLLDARDMIECADWSVDRAIYKLTINWTDDEKKKVGIKANGSKA